MRTYAWKVVLAAAVVTTSSWAQGLAKPHIQSIDPPDWFVQLPEPCCWCTAAG